MSYLGSGLLLANYAFAAGVAMYKVKSVSNPVLIFYTLSPKPYFPNPKLQTLYPIPLALSSEHYSLNHKPYTLDPEP